MELDSAWSYSWRPRIRRAGREKKLEIDCNKQVNWDIMDIGMCPILMVHIHGVYIGCAGVFMG